jgi:hypothetical protein
VAYTSNLGPSSFAPVSLGQTFAELTSIFVPGGWYLITSKVVLTNTNIAIPSLARCTVTRSGSLLDISEVTVAEQSGKATLTLHAATLVGAAGEHLKLNCQTDAPGTATATLWQLTAIQVSNVTLPGP